MPDAKHFSRDAPEAHPVGNVELIECDFTEAVRVVPVGHQDRRDRRRILARLAAEDLKAPRPHRAPRRFCETVVPREHIVESLLVQHVNRLGEPVKNVGRRGIGEITVLVGRDHVLPRPEGFWQLRGLRCGERLVTDGVEGNTGRQHQPLLRPADRDVDAPFVVPVIHRRERRDRVHDEERGMPGSINRLADFSGMRDAARRGFVVQHRDRLDLAVFILAQLRLDCFWVRAHPPIGFNEDRIEAELRSHVLPECSELAGLEHEHAVAGRKRIHERSFPRTSPGRRIDDDRVLRLENGLDAVEYAPRKTCELGTPMVDDRHVHCAQDAIGQWRGSRNLQKMPAGRARTIRSH